MRLWQGLGLVPEVLESHRLWCCTACLSSAGAALCGEALRRGSGGPGEGGQSLALYNWLGILICFYEGKARLQSSHLPCLGGGSCVSTTPGEQNRL